MLRIVYACLFALVVLPVYATTSIEEFTKEMSKHEGFVAFYYDQQSDKVYLELTGFDLPMLFQSSMPHGIGSNDIGLDRGQLGDTRIVEFERFGNKVLLKQLNTAYRADTDNLAEQASIDEAFADSVIAGFAIEAQTENRVLIDYTSFLFSDIHGIGARLNATKQGQFSADAGRSGVYLPRSKSFVDNTELEALVTYKGSAPGEYLQQVAPDPQSVTVHLHHSFVRLPDDEYQPRAFHSYSGYWKHAYFDYATPIDQPLEKRFIVRHRLNKKQPDAAVSEAVEPIIYYLDPGIPEPVMSALKDGASWWNQAFEAIGYDNAFQVKVLPPEADPMDVRYNVIQWVHRATRGWSYGASVVDPRTGELIKGHVTLGSLRVRQDYLIALGLTSPFNDNAASDVNQTQKDMALARIRQLSAHEVGHTLGIAHNFAASENQRASVMDYPHPLITLKRGKVSLEGAYATGIGEWDKHVIAYGYQDYLNTADEVAGLKAQIERTFAAGMLYKSDPDARPIGHASADGHLWDNGSNPVDELNRLNDVRAAALKHFGTDTIEAGVNLSELRNRLVPIYLLHRYQLDAVAKQLGGVNYFYEQKIPGTTPTGVVPVNASQQSEALRALLRTTGEDYLKLPTDLQTLLVPLAYGEDQTREQFKGQMGGVFDALSAAESAAAYSFKLLLHPHRLNRLAMQHHDNARIPSPAQVAQQMLQQHWYQTDGERSVLAQRLALVALDALVNALQHDELAAEVQIALQRELLGFETYLQKRRNDQQATVLLRHLARYWAEGEWSLQTNPQPLPPGSPI